MVTFAPTLNTVNAPDWTNITKPISQPAADESKGIALKTIGEGISGTVNAVETGVEDFLKDKVRAGVDSLRDTTTLAYEDIRRAQVTGTNPDPRAVKTAGFDGSLLPPGTTDVPASLQAGLDRAGRLATAKAQGKANDTLYTGALNSMAKELRAQFPGHRDFIDEQISRISGINPANAYMNNLLTDINRNSAREDTFQKSVLSLAAKHLGNPEVQKWWVANENGVPNAFQGLQQATFKAEQRYYQHEGWKMENEQAKGDQAADADLAQRQFEVRTQQLAQEHLNPVIDIPGLSSPQTMSKIIQDAQTGKITLTPVQWEQLQQNIQAAKRNFDAHVDSVAAGEGYARRINNPAMVTAVKQRNGQFLDAMLQAVTDKNVGTMYAVKRYNDLSLDQSQKSAYDSPIGEWLRQRQILNQSLGPNWMNITDSMDITRGDKLQDLRKFYGNATTAAGAPPDLRNSNEVKSLYDSLNAAKKAKEAGFRAPDQVYDNLVQNVDLIEKALGQQRPDIAKNVVDYMFDPAKNGKLMDFWGRDFVDANGKTHKGRFATFDILSQPKIVDSVNRIGDRDSWNKFRDWQEMSFKTLFGGEIKNLASIQTDKSIPFKMTWDNRNFKMGIEWGEKPQDAVSQRYMAQAEASVRALNGGIGNLAYTYSKDGSDPSERIFDILGSLGYSPNDRMMTTGLPQKVQDAIRASSVKPKTPEERLKETFERLR